MDVRIAIEKLKGLGLFYDIDKEEIVQQVEKTERKHRGISPKKWKEVKCKNCGETFVSRKSWNAKFCDRSCSAQYRHSKGDWAKK